MIQMNLLAKHKETHRLRKLGYWGEGIAREFGTDMDTQSAVIELSGCSQRNWNAVGGAPGESFAFVKTK